MSTLCSVKESVQLFELAEALEIRRIQSSDENLSLIFEHNWTFIADLSTLNLLASMSNIQYLSTI